MGVLDVSWSTCPAPCLQRAVIGPDQVRMHPLA